jgi:hypothetical protein
MENPMKAISRTLLVVLFAVMGFGCDSTPTDTENFTGVWTLQTISHTPGGVSTDYTAAFKQGVSVFQATFKADKTDNLVVTYTAAAKTPAGGSKVDINNNGTFAVNETGKTLVLTNLGNTLTFNYAFTSGNTKEVSLSAPAALINAVFGTTAYQGTVTIKATKP